MSDATSTASPDDVDPAAVPAVEIELSAEEAAALFAVGEMLNNPSIDPAPAEPAPSLAALLLASGAPLRLEDDAAKGLRLVATREIAAGETLLEESALAWMLCRSPGSDGVFSMTDQAGRVVATLPPWALLRTLRDTLTLAPEHALRAEAAYATLAQLSALGSRARGAWADAPALPPGLEAGGAEEAMPPRVQFLQAVAQSNAFATALPAEDSAWKRALLWPALGRMRSVADRERMFDERAPFSYVSGFFVLGALFNHSCAPNVAYTACAWAEGEPAPRIRFVASRAIAVGEEALHSYIDSDVPAEARRKKLLLTYRFRCACERCAAEVPGLAAGADPLAQHFPYGLGPEGLSAFYARGGKFPIDDPDAHPTEE